MSKSFGQSFRIDKSHSILAVKVFCSWDFKVIKKTSVRLMSENICTQLKVNKHILSLFFFPLLLNWQECVDTLCSSSLHIPHLFLPVIITSLSSSSAPSRSYWQRLTIIMSKTLCARRCGDSWFMA